MRDIMSIWGLAPILEDFWNYAWWNCMNLHPFAVTLKFRVIIPLTGKYPFSLIFRFKDRLAEDNTLRDSFWTSNLPFSNSDLTPSTGFVVLSNRMNSCTFRKSMSPPMRLFFPIFDHRGVCKNKWIDFETTVFTCLYPHYLAKSGTTPHSILF